MEERVYQLIHPRGESPGGQRILVAVDALDQTAVSIIGVSAAIRRVGSGGKTLPQIFLPFAQSPGDDATVLLRTASDPLSVVPALRSQVLAINKKLPLSNVAPMNDLLTGEKADQSFEAAAVGLFAALALILADLGIYGVISYMVSQRTNIEVGIRMAPGAEKRGVPKVVINQGLKLALIGLTLGIAGALALTRFLFSLLYGIKPTDPLTFIVVSLILVVVVLAACYIPARRAANVDPMVVLRYE